MIYEARLVDAMNAAPILDVESSTLTLQNIDPEVSSNAVVVESAEKLRVLLSEFLGIMGLSKSFLPVEDITRHEDQHAKARRELGLIGTSFGLLLFHPVRSIDDLAVVAFTTAKGVNSLSPLEIASVAAHPDDPSIGDIEQVLNQGFRNIDEVADSAVRNNLSGGRHIPVPLSHSAGGSKR